MRQQDDDRALFMISVAAELADMHPQTLRLYERRGLVRPQRTAKNTRRYSQRDVERLQRIQQLTELGLNLAGVERVLAMEEQMNAMAAEVQRLQARLEDAAAAMHRGGGILEPRLQALDLGGHGVHLLFHGQHALHAGEVEPPLGELLDALQPLYVALRVAARVLGRALRAHQPAPLVQAQRLRVHAGQLGRHRDHEERSVVVLLSHRSASPPQPSTAARGSGRVAPSFSNSCFCSLVSLSGTCTCSRTWRSPWPPLSLGAPLPRTRNVRLSWLPAGTLRATRPPPGVGILTLVPSAASEIVTGTSRTTSSPRRSNSSSGSTPTLTKRSPDGPPRRPASPLPLMRILLPSLTPAGILTA